MCTTTPLPVPCVTLTLWLILYGSGTEWEWDREGIHPHPCFHTDIFQCHCKPWTTNFTRATFVQKQTCACQSEVPASRHLCDLYRWGKSHLCQHLHVISAPKTQLTMWIGPTDPQRAKTCMFIKHPELNNCYILITLTVSWVLTLHHLLSGKNGISVTLPAFVSQQGYSSPWKLHCKCTASTNFAKAAKKIHSLPFLSNLLLIESYIHTTILQINSEAFHHCLNSLIIVIDEVVHGEYKKGR